MVKWLLLTSLTGICWYFVLSNPKKKYPRDWRLKPFDLTEEDEQEFHLGARKLTALTCAVVLSVFLIIALVMAVLHR